MNSTTAILCKKPVLGVLMWLSTLCATNQALHDSFIDLKTTGVILSKKIDIPTDEKYSLLLLLRTTEVADQSAVQTKGRWAAITCGAQVQEPREATDAGTPSPPLSLTVEILGANGKQVSKAMFSPICPRPTNDMAQYLRLGSIDMKRGEYKLELSNGHPISLDSATRVQVLFMGQGAGFP